MALRSLIETVACQRLVVRRGYIAETAYLENLDSQAQILAKKLQAFRNSLSRSNQVKEDQAAYDIDDIE